MKTIGILTWRKGRYLEEASFFARFSLEAEKMGYRVVVFAPSDIRGGKVKGLVYHSPSNRWHEGIYTKPDIIYDRFRNMSQPSFMQFVHFRQKSDIPFINSRMANKWNLHRYLSTNPEIRQWLPDTALLSYHSLKEFINKYNRVYIKPINGTGGKGIFRIERQKDIFRVDGLTNGRHPFSSSFSLPALQNFLKNIIKESRYIIQQGLDLTLAKGHVSDMRWLIQKDRDGIWQITGAAVKIGKLSRIVSNMHSGGKIFPPHPFLSRFFSGEKVEKILEECTDLARRIPPFIEKQFGRMCEFGLDIGIDKNGKVWLIEVNPKPGRDIFKQLGDRSGYLLAVRRPLEYAIHLLQSAN